MALNKRNKVTLGALAGLSLVGAVGGTLAYLTDSEEAKNTFTIGDVSIESEEPNWPGNDDDSPNGPKDITPNDEIAKDPLVENTGINDAIVFTVVDSPMEKITVINDDGTLNTAKSVNEIFWFKDADDALSDHANNFDAKWTELASKEMYVKIAADGTETKVEEADLETVYDALEADAKLVKRYVFGYSEAIQGSSKTDGTAQTEENKKTTSIFDKVQLKNVLEGELDEAPEEIVIRTYAIQANKVLEDSVDLTETISAENLAKVYDIFVAQNSTDDDKSGLKVEGMRDADDVTPTENGASGTFDQHVNRWNTTDDVSGEGAHVKP